MSKPDDNDRRHDVTKNAASGADLGGSTLLPMLVGGVILIIVGALGLMFFV